ncbi:MAG: hypothetical protein G3M70_12155 [Candidatus Nitronauta litoralis]|uniref:Uncharacterized protein n=1 Tax=Candidatus Nitronauta litoralis TaxID=2705533 RepID=A0A7T0G0N5_9BACT|nr:MAG: hypothetical protein G3M70_12155 [Candidatus Nitronauta litoralis]
MTSIRYYLICIFLILGLTLVISWVRQTRTRKEFLQIMVWVTVSLIGSFILLMGFSELLVFLDIAESGFL